MLDRDWPFTANGLDCNNGVTPEEILDYAESKTVNPERLVGFTQFVETLSNEAGEILEIILNTPAELLTDITVNKSAVYKGILTMQDIKNYLRYYGWKFQVIDGAIGELREKTKKFLAYFP